MIRACAPAGSEEVQVRLAAVRSIARIEAARSGSRTNVLAELLTTETDRTGHYTNAAAVARSSLRFP